MTHRISLVLAAIAAAPLAAQSLGGHVAYTDQLGVVRADSNVYRAAFTRAGASIAVPALGDDAAQPRLELRFVAARRGGVQLVGGQAVMPKQDGERVDFDRGAIVERYLISNSGFEQRFRIAERPAGHGDLRLVMRVAGNVTATAVVPEHRAIAFRHDDVDVIRYGEARVLDRGGHQQPIATGYDGHGRLELIVPASFLDQAVYPVTVDPAVGPIVNPGGPSFDDTNPDVVFAPVYGDQYFVVWQREFSPTNIVLRAQRFDRDGNATSATLPITSGGKSTNPAAVVNRQHRVLVVFEANDRIEGLWVDLYTNQTENPFVCSQPAAGERDRRPAVSSLGQGTPFQIAWDRTLAGATDPQEIVTRHWYPAFFGIVQPGPEVVLESAPAWSGHVRNVRLPATSWSEIIVAHHFDVHCRAVWDRFYLTPAPGDFDVRTCSFTNRDSSTYASNSFTLDQPPIVVSSNIGTDELAPAIGAQYSAAIPGVMNYCVAWQASGDVRAQMFEQSGAAGTAFDVRVTTDFEGMPAVGAGRCEFTIAYGQVAPSSFDVDIRAARVLADGTVTVSDRPVDVGAGAVQSHIRICSNDTVTTTTNSAFVAWTGKTGPAGSAVNDVRGRVFEPVDALHTWFGSACAGPAGELPHIYADRKAVPGSLVRIWANDAPPLSVGVLVCSNQLVSLPIPGAPGCSAYVGTPFVVTLAQAFDANGDGYRQVFIPCSIPVPITLAFQWAFLTPGHNALGLITSDDMDITWVQ